MATEALTGRILCIDDDARMRRAVANSLVALGVEVVEASGMTDALDHASNGTRFEMVLCDYVLEGTDGLELIGKLKPYQPHAAYALMTGVTDINLLIGAINSRTISYFILKPWHAEELREVVRTAFSVPKAAPAAAPVLPAKADTPQLLKARAPLLVLAAAGGVLVASTIALVLGERAARRDARFLAQRVADVAIVSPLAAVEQLAGRGVTYVTVSDSKGELVAFDVDRESAQVPGSDRDAAIALREVGATERLFVAESRNEALISQVGVGVEAFNDSVAELRILLLASGVFAALAASAAFFIR